MKVRAISLVLLSRVPHLNIKHTLLRSCMSMSSLEAFPTLFVLFFIKSSSITITQPALPRLWQGHSSVVECIILQRNFSSFCKYAFLQSNVRMKMQKGFPKTKNERPEINTLKAAATDIPRKGQIQSHGHLSYWFLSRY